MIVYNPNGCDSLAIIDLTIFPSSINTVFDTACDIYLWDGISYDSSNLYVNIYQDVNGCDSTVNLYLTILTSGCMDPLALNYDSLASCSSSCIYPQCNIVLVDSQNVSCFGGNDGYIQVGGIGGFGLFHYSLQLFNSTIGSWQQIVNLQLVDIHMLTYTTSLMEDCYKIVMTDSLNCNDTLDICISQPTEIFTYDTIISVILTIEWINL